MLALLALVVSTGSLVVSVLSLRTSGARVSLDVSWVGEKQLRVTVANNGRLGVPVKAAKTELFLYWAGDRKHLVESVELEGPALPHTVNAGDDQDWLCRIEDYNRLRDDLAATPPSFQVKCGARWVRATIPRAVPEE